VDKCDQDNFKRFIIIENNYPGASGIFGDLKLFPDIFNDF